MLAKISAAWAWAELTLAALLAVAISGLILLNVVTRSLGAAIYWTDELAIYAMVWMTFLAASAALHHRQSIAVTIFRDYLPPRFRLPLAKAVDLVIFVFACLMVWFCWRWFMPLDLLRAGFDVEAFQAETFNFIYAEPTTTLRIPKVWVWLVMWLFALGALLHSVTNLLEPPGGTEPAK
ncbi:Tripartite ATP-independent transporter, DctQ component [Salinihabitans flavidus]|uniref:TRAP transporter small permease protein n=1 Tax=Salinihabitans flavidus TaxID=569882 RepID=A0A1H8TYT7_9RHOB|nr:TRAP transporter small permease subunit [Salinihabitans flavidus]SEO96159.1 Tripartite ATP-independent transporter, DctQ component [Salinihabitans flavidus]